jgi:hypothetical protein
MPDVTHEAFYEHPACGCRDYDKKPHAHYGERRYIVYRGEKVTIAKSLRKTVGRYWMIANGNLSMVVPGWAKGES